MLPCWIGTSQQNLGSWPCTVHAMEEVGRPGVDRGTSSLGFFLQVGEAGRQDAESLWGRTASRRTGQSWVLGSAATLQGAGPAELQTRPAASWARLAALAPRSIHRSARSSRGAVCCCAGS